MGYFCPCQLCQEKSSKPLSLVFVGSISKPLSGSERVLETLFLLLLPFILKSQISQTYLHFYSDSDVFGDSERRKISFSLPSIHCPHDLGDLNFKLQEGPTSCLLAISSNSTPILRRLPTKFRHTKFIFRVEKSFFLRRIYQHHLGPTSWTDLKITSSDYAHSNGEGNLTIRAQTSRPCKAWLIQDS